MGLFSFYVACNPTLYVLFAPGDNAWELLWALSQMATNVNVHYMHLNPVLLLPLLMVLEKTNKEDLTSNAMYSYFLQQPQHAEKYKV